MKMVVLCSSTMSSNDAATVASAVIAGFSLIVLIANICLMHRQAKFQEKKMQTENLMTLWDAMAGLVDLPLGQSVTGSELAKTVNTLELLALSREQRFICDSIFDTIYRDNFVRHCERVVEAYNECEQADGSTKRVSGYAYLSETSFVNNLYRGYKGIGLEQKFAQIEKRG